MLIEKENSNVDRQKILNFKNYDKINLMNDLFKK